MFEFAPPANVDDLSDDLKSEWSSVVHGWFQSAQARLVDNHGQSPSDVRLFNLVDTPSGASGLTADIPWNGFPRKYRLVFSNEEERWQIVEQPVNADLTGRQAPYYKPVSGGFIPADNIRFRDQDEYCEWHSSRNANGDLVKVVFTCENPEYWRFIAENDSDLLLSLYQQLTDQPVSMSDLLFDEDIFIPSAGGAVNQNGKYNPYNKWNSTDGAIHLTHPANSLSAEVFLAADATILRTGDNGPVTSPGELVCCSAYGGPDRSSDPTIGAAVNGLVQQGLSVTIDDPVGLYIHSLDPAPFEFPDGVTFDDCWKVIRGNQQAHQILRAEFSLPDGGPLNEVLIGGEPLRFGSQISEFVSIVIFGRAFDSRAGLPAAMSCVGHCCVNPSLPALQTIQGVGVPCPPVPGPGAIAAAAEAAPVIERIAELTNVKDLYTR